MKGPQQIGTEQLCSLKESLPNLSVRLIRKKVSIFQGAWRLKVTLSDESRFTLFQSDGCIRVRKVPDEGMHTSCLVPTGHACWGSCNLRVLKLVRSRFSDIMCPNNEVSWPGYSINGLFLPWWCRYSKMTMPGVIGLKLSVRGSGRMRHNWNLKALKLNIIVSYFFFGWDFFCLSRQFITWVLSLVCQFMCWNKWEKEKYGHLCVFFRSPCYFPVSIDTPVVPTDQKALG